MAWKCSTCGFENEPSKTICDGGCGYIRFGIVVFTAKSTGCSVKMGVDTSVGKRLLATFAGDDARYASEPQFHLAKDMSLGKWFVIHDSAAKNPTFLNGSTLSAKSPLDSGSLLSIGPERLQLSVKIEV